MRCYEPNTDQSAEFVLLVNGTESMEYDCLLPSITDRNVLECVVPVSEGDSLTIRGKFEGEVRHATFDVLADGTYVGTKRISVRHANPREESRPEYLKASVTFEVFTTVTDPDNAVLHTPSAQIIEGKLCVRELSEYPGVLVGDQLGVGSLAVIVSLAQHNNEKYEHGYADCMLGNWKHRERSDVVADGAIPPTHELALMRNGPTIRTTTQSEYQRSFLQRRAGSCPWAKFVFYYRDRRTVAGAQCMQRSSGAHALDPGLQPTLQDNQDVTGRKRKRRNDDSKPEHMLATKTDHQTVAKPKKKLMNQPFPKIDLKSVFPGGLFGHQHTLKTSDRAGSDHTPGLAQIPDQPDGSPLFEPAEEKLHRHDGGTELPIPDQARSSSTSTDSQSDDAVSAASDNIVPLSIEDVKEAISTRGATMKELYNHFKHWDIPINELFNQIEEFASIRNGRYHLNRQIEIERQLPGFSDGRQGCSEQYRERRWREETNTREVQGWETDDLEWLHYEHGEAQDEWGQYGLDMA